MPQFERYIGIDFSGAETPDSNCRGLRVGFSGETREIPPKHKVKFLALGKLRRLEAVRIRDGVKLS